MDNENRLLSERQGEAITGWSVFTLRNDRAKYSGIPLVKNGRQVLYSLQDVIQFMESRKVQTN